MNYEGLKNINTRKEVAEYLGVTTKTIDREIERGRLRAFRVGSRVRIGIEQVREYIESQIGGNSEH